MAKNQRNGADDGPLHHTAGDDHIRGGRGGDEIRGGSGDDTIFGGAGDDRLRGDNGNDILNGGAGNDRLRGDHGDDILTGGAGRDRFIFNLQGGHDTVNDFTHGVDRMDFTNFNFTSAQDVLGAAHQVGADIVIELPTGTVVTLLHTDLGTLTAQDFLI